jgi:hypothetical protein
MTVLSAYPVESEVPLEFAGLADLLEAVPSVVDELPGIQRQAVRQAVFRVEPLHDPADPRTIATAVLSFLRILAKQQPVLVIVDDLPWLDTPSARALSFALRRLRLEPVGLLAAARTGWSGGVPAVATDGIPAERMDHLRLGPLSLGAIRELLATRARLCLAGLFSCASVRYRVEIRCLPWNWPRDFKPECRQGRMKPLSCLIRFADWCSAGLPACRPGHATCCSSAPLRLSRRCRSSALLPSIQLARMPISMRASGRASWPRSTARSLSFIRWCVRWSLSRRSQQIAALPTVGWLPS